MSAPQQKQQPRDVHLTIEHGPKPTDFRYHASANGDPIDNPRQLELDRHERITFECANNFSIRFRESPFQSPFDPPGQMVLPASWSGSQWTILAHVRSEAVYHHWYHYTVVMGDHSTDDPEIIIEQL